MSDPSSAVDTLADESLIRLLHQRHQDMGDALARKAAWRLEELLAPSSARDTVLEEAAMECQRVADIGEGPQGVTHATALWLRDNIRALKDKPASASGERQALREIGAELPHGEWLLNAVLRALGKPECKGSFVPKKNSFSNRWQCDCGKTLSDCPSREALK